MTPEFQIGDIVCEKTEYELPNIGTRKVSLHWLIPLRIIGIVEDDTLKIDNPIRYTCEIVIHPAYDMKNEEEVKELKLRIVKPYEYQLQLFSNVREAYIKKFEDYTKLIKEYT